jgi:histidinol-phosphate aminotransferase
MARTATYQWQPTTEEIARRAGIDASAVIRADHNTSPFTPPWVADVAAGAATRVNEYPAADYRALREAIAAHTGVGAAAMVPGAGADELIDLCAAAFLSPGETAVGDDPTYPMYRIATVRRGGVYRAVPRTAVTLQFPRERMVEEAAEADITWLCGPHNPTGDGLRRDDVSAVAAAARGIVVLDGAYAEFADDRWGEMLAATPNLVVVGTLSKAFSLAGARVGYALAAPDLAARIAAFRPPGSISTVSASLALRSLTETGWMEEHVAATVRLRDALAAGLQDLGMEPRPSVTNFVLAPVGPHARDLAARLMQRGIVVRAFAPDHALAEFLRITVRLPEQQERLLAALEEETR